MRRAMTCVYCEPKSRMTIFEPANAAAAAMGRVAKNVMRVATKKARGASADPAPEHEKRGKECREAGRDRHVAPVEHGVTAELREQDETGENRHHVARRAG